MLDNAPSMHEGANVVDVAPQDLKRVIQVLAGLAAHSTLEPRARKLRLVEGLCEIIQADIYMWTQIVLDSNSRPSAMSVIDGGWKSPQQRTEFFEFIMSSLAAATEVKLFQRLGTAKFFIGPLTDLVSPNDLAFKGCRDLGIDPGLLGCYRVSKNLMCGVGIHRHYPPTASSSSPTPPPMSNREAQIAHLLLADVDALHTDGTDSPVTNRLTDLTERQRTVLLLLLGGESRKQIARQLKLSEYTVADYIQALYRIFNVFSRAELMSLFLSGKTNATLSTLLPNESP